MRSQQTEEGKNAGQWNGLVAGACNVPNALRLPFRLELAAIDTRKQSGFRDFRV